MTPELQEALSFRWIAPRVVRLDCGLFALCPMVGDDPPVILSGDALLLAIPTTRELDLSSSSSHSTPAGPKGAKREVKPTPTLNQVLDLL